MKFTAVALLGLVAADAIPASQMYPRYRQSVWINPTGADAPGNLTRCINIFSDDDAKLMEITTINKDVSENVWMQFPASTT